MTLSLQSQSVKSFKRLESIWHILAATLIIDATIFIFNDELIPKEIHDWLIFAMPVVFSLSILTLFHDEILGYSSFIAETRFKLISPGSYVLKGFLLLFLIAVVGFEVFIKLGSSSSLSTLAGAAVILFFSVKPIFKSAINYLRIQSEQAKIRLRYEDLLESQFFLLSIGAISLSRIGILLFAASGDGIITLAAAVIFLMNKPNSKDFIEPCPICIASRSKVLTYFPGCKNCYPIKFKEFNQEEELLSLPHKESPLKKRASEFLKTRIPLPKGRKTAKQNAESSQKE